MGDTSDESASVTEATMDVQKLLMDEIEHELYVRKIDTTGCVDNKAKLSEVIAQPVDPAQLEALDLESELEIIGVKLSELKVIVSESAKTLRFVREGDRAISLYLHLMMRVRREMFVDASFYSKFYKLVKSLNLIQTKLNIMVDNLIFPKIYDSEDEAEELEILKQRQKRARAVAGSSSKQKQPEKTDSPKAEAETSSRKKDKSKKYRESKVIVSPSEESGSETDHSSRASSRHSRSSSRTSKQSKSRFNPLSKVKSTFSKSEDLHSFLVEVEEAAEMYNMEDDDIPSAIGILLKGDAKTWHRAKIKMISSWDDYKVEIKCAFAPDDDDTSVLAKIDSLKQSSDETFAVFESKFAELFGRLSRPLNERERIRKIMNGLHSYYRSRVLLSEIDSLRTLRSKCKKMEADKSHVLQQEQAERKRERRREEKEIEKLRKGIKAAAVSCETEGECDEAEEDTPTVLLHETSSIALLCWRCGGSGHLSINCTTAIFCIRCGTQGTVAERCERCRNSGLWTPAPGNFQRDATGGAQPSQKPQAPVKIAKPGNSSKGTQPNNQKKN